MSTMYTVEQEWEGTFSVASRRKVKGGFTQLQHFATYSTLNRAQRLRNLLEELDKEERGDWSAEN